MQKPSSKVNSVQADGKYKASGTQKAEGVQERLPLKVDYLTPLSRIQRPELYIYKEKRRLYIIQSNVLVRDYPIGLGFQAAGDKEKRGDGRTPEGDFLIYSKESGQRFQKALGLNYPDRKHAERAFFSGVITQPELRSFLLAFENRVKPPWNTELGGPVLIHSGGAHGDWTDGSVALYNSDMDELYQITSIGTPVSIRP